MSDLSFLIQTQNEVVIDQKYLEKYLQENQQNQFKKHSLGLPKNKASKDIKLNKTSTQLEFNQSNLRKPKKNLISIQNVEKKKLSSQSTATAPSEIQKFSKLSMRINALQEKQKRLQQRIGVDFFQIKENLIESNRKQNQQIKQVLKIKSDVNKTKRKIDQFLTLISTKTN